MTKVEELRDGIVSVCDVFIRPQSEAALIEERIGDLISAVDADAFARGKAEGVEQEAAKIVHCYECVGGDEHTPEKDQCMLWGEGKDCYCSRGKRVLAPTKEKP